jgi:branched-chain amino acid transport system ATP-binding protein
VSLLQVNDIRVSYGPIAALHGVSFGVDAGRLVGIIGRNGAGKSTTMRAICGAHRPWGGSITFDGKRIDQLPAHEVVRLGVAYVPEGRRIFADMSVLDNLQIGGYVHYGRRATREAAQKLEEVFGLFPVLRERAGQAGGTLSGGQQQMLAIARGLMSSPRLLLLDEPSMGLAPIVVNDVFNAIRRLHQQGMTIVLVEQKAFMTLKMVDFAHVLVHGEIKLSGTGAELLASDEVKASYLGRGRSAGAAPRPAPQAAVAPPAVAPPVTPGPAAAEAAAGLPRPVAAPTAVAPAPVRTPVAAPAAEPDVRPPYPAPVVAPAGLPAERKVVDRTAPLAGPPLVLPAAAAEEIAIDIPGLPHPVAPPREAGPMAVQRRAVVDRTKPPAPPPEPDGAEPALPRPVRPAHIDHIGGARP